MTGNTKRLASRAASETCRKYKAVSGRTPSCAVRVTASSGETFFTRDGAVSRGVPARAAVFFSCSKGAKKRIAPVAA